MSNLKLNNTHWLSLHSMHKAGKHALGYATTFDVFDGSPGREVFSINHHGNQIARVAPFRMSFSHRGYNSRTTVDRLNRIATDNWVPVRFAIRKGLASVFLPGSKGFEPFTWVHFIMNQDGVWEVTPN